jgi:hypothetical protein
VPDTRSYHALVIGIADYQQVRKLPRTQDARDVAALLRNPDQGGYPPEQVHLLEDGDATRTAIEQGLAKLAGAADEKSTVFIYFSGHGARVKSGLVPVPYLLPVEASATADELPRTAISGNEFRDALNAIRAHRLTVVLDCCHSGGIGEIKDLVGPEVELGLPDAYLDALKSGKGRGRVILAAAREGEPAYVVPGARYGAFTEQLLAGLRGGVVGAGGVIRILDLFHYVQQRLEQTQPTQHPLLKAEVEENYPVALYRGGEAPPPPPVTRADDFKYDVFVSYRQQEPDKSWVRRTLVPRLKDAGIRVFIDYLDFRLGAPIIREMERAVEESRYTVAVLSPAYLRSNFTELEGLLAQQLGLERSQRRFIGLLRESCTPRLGIRALYYLDMTDDAELDVGIARLIAQLGRPPGSPAFAAPNTIPGTDRREGDRIARENGGRAEFVPRRSPGKPGSPEGKGIHMTQSRQVIACVPRLLPRQEWVNAARNAIAVNPDNRPPGLDESALHPGGGGERLALDITRYWGTGGVQLTVGFIDTPDTALRKRILEHMHAWSKAANVGFVETCTDPQVRIARWTAEDSPGDEGYWSNLGTDIRLISKERPTMNLEAFTMSTPDSEFFRVVRHETGHTLGFPHEHLRQAIIDRLDREKVIANFMRTQGWSRQEVIDQVLTPLEEASILGTEAAEETSIMCYHIDGALTTNGLPVVGGTDITEQDYAFAASVYPKK